MPKLSGKRITSAAATNFLAASNLLDLARSTEEGNFYWSMASLVFSAFAYEAFLNEVGPRVVSAPEWGKINRASWKRKHEAVYAALKLNADNSAIAVLSEIFEFRNRMAHGREEEVLLDSCHVADLRPLTLQDATSTALEKKCTPVFAAAAVECVRQAGIAICKGMRLPCYGTNPFGSPSRGFYGSDTDA